VCIAQLQQLRGHGDRDGGGLLARDAADADGHGEARDDFGAEAALRQALAEARGLGLRADHARPGEAAVLEERLADGEVLVVAVGHDERPGIGRHVAHFVLGLRCEQAANGIGHRLRELTLAAIHPRDAKRQRRQDVHECAAHVAGAEEPEVRLLEIGAFVERVAVRACDHLRAFMQRRAFLQRFLGGQAPRCTRARGHRRGEYAGTRIAPGDRALDGCEIARIAALEPELDNATAALAERGAEGKTVEAGGTGCRCEQFARDAGGNELEMAPADASDLAGRRHQHRGAWLARRRAAHGRDHDANDRGAVVLQGFAESVQPIPHARASSESYASSSACGVAGARRRGDCFP